jgi:hypothetical protein
VLEFLNSEEFCRFLTTGGHGFKRSLPREDALERVPDIVRLLRDVLVSGRSEGNEETNPALRECCHNGWLQAELVREDSDPEETRAVYVFPTKVHQWYKFFIGFAITITGG